MLSPLGHSGNRLKETDSAGLSLRASRMQSAQNCRKNVTNFSLPNSWRNSDLRPKMKSSIRFKILALVALAAVSVAAQADQPVNIAVSIVGDAGNAADPATGSAYGSVGYTYGFGTYDVTVIQYCTFLNAVAQTDPYGLYNTSMATDANIGPSISRIGVSGSYYYLVLGGAVEQLPITYVSWFDAARFCNWMNNGEPVTHVEDATTTETGAYTLNGDTTVGLETKNPLAQWYIPSENEWYKAAYYDPSLNSGQGGYWGYATRSNTVPGNQVGSLSNQANYYTGVYSVYSGVYSVTQSSSYSSSQNYLTPVGSFTNSASAYGTYDQEGDVWNWNDAVISGSSRGFRGGNWYDSSYSLASSTRTIGYDPAHEDGAIGFRVAEAPEPTSVMLMALGGTLSASMRRRP